MSYSVQSQTQLDLISLRSSAKADKLYSISPLGVITLIILL